MVLIHEFNPEVYPFKFYVAVFNEETDDVAAYAARFNDGWSNGPLKTDMIEENDAVTYFVSEVGHNNRKGVLIVFNRPEVLTMKVVTHECTHAARFIWRYLGEDITGWEADAYLIGWMAKCIEEVKNGETK